MKLSLLYIFFVVFSIVSSIAQPIVTDLKISEDKIAGHILTGDYTYNPGTVEGASEYRWYRATDIFGTGADPIPLEDTTIYTIQTSDISFYIGFEVTPVDEEGNRGDPQIVFIGPIVNAVPAIVVDSISGDRHLYQTLTAHITYSDQEGDPEGASKYQWFRSSDRSGSYNPIEGAEILDYTITFNDKDQFIYFRVVPFAKSGAGYGLAAYSDTIQVANTAPSATVSKISGTREIGKQLEVFVEYEDLENDNIVDPKHQWYSSTNSTGPYSAIPDADSLIHTITIADKDQYLYFMVIPTAERGTSPGLPAYSDTIQIANTAPTATVSKISGTKEIGHELKVSVKLEDLENDTVNISQYQWYRSLPNGSYVPIPGATSLSYTITLDDKDKFLYFQVIPIATSGTNPGLPAYSDTIQIANTAPTATVSKISGTKEIGHELKVSVKLIDLENDTINISQYQWYRSLPNGSFTPIPGATSLAYTITLDDKDKFLYFQVIPIATSGTNPGDPAYSDTIQVVNTPPYAVVNKISGTPRIAYTLTASYTFHDLENDAQGTSVLQWYRSENRKSGYVAVAGENDLDYLVTLADKGYFLYFEVIPVTESGVYGIAMHSDTVRYINSAPSALNVTITGTPAYNDTLQGNYTFMDADNDPESSSTFRWLIASDVDGPFTPIPGATELTYIVGLNDVDNYIYFEVVPVASEGELQSLPYVSNTVFVGNDAPVASNVIINGSFQLGQVLQGNYTYTDRENNEEGASVYKWFRANSAAGLGKEQITGANSDNYLIKSADNNKYISFEVTPYALTGTLKGATVMSPYSGPVSNAPPVASNIIISGSRVVCKTLTATYDYYDLEGDAEGETSFRWLRSNTINGEKTEIPGAIDTFYTLTTEDQGKYVFFEVTPRPVKGNIYSLPKLSNPGSAILNILPNVIISGGKAICSGQTTPINFIFSGTPPFTLEYTDGTNNYSFITSSYAHNVSVANAGNYKGLQLTDNLNCPVTNLESNTTIIVNELPAPKIIGLKEAYSVNSAAIQLVGDPSGGTFSGNGVFPATNKFYPAIAGADTVAHPIVYTYTSPANGCVNFDTVFVKVYSIDALIVGLRSSYKYCNFDKPVILTGVNKVDGIGNFAISGGIGLSDNNNNTAILDPSMLAPGQYTISYTYFDNVNQTINQTITVEQIEKARIFGISDGNFCKNSSSINLTGNYSTGVFTGAGILSVSGSTRFVPSSANNGRNPVYFKYSTSYGCNTIDSVVLNISPLPRPAFEVQNSCWNGDSTAFINLSQPMDSIISWEWNFGDINSTKNKSGLFAPKHHYSGVGDRKVTLIAQNTMGCRDTISKNVHLGDIPVVNFTWNNECFRKDQVIQFKNLSTGIDSITKYRWTVYDTTSVPFTYASANMSHVFPLERSYNVKLVVNSLYNCKDSIQKTMSVLPVHIVKDTVYNNNFESGNGQWLIKPSQQASWVWGMPDGSLIKSAYSGTKAYYTKFNAPRVNNQLEVGSPCFDFSDVQRPFIELRINYDALSGSEGAVFQYTSDDSINWKNIGNVGTGVNWYTDNAISSSPGGQKTGWSGSSNGWIQARHNLDSLKNKKFVKFRIVYGEQINATAKDGFAFDDVYIGQRSKSVLFEQFSNISSANSNSANTELYKILDNAGVDAVSIQYHTSFPGPDSINASNPSDPGARILFYGVGSVPECILDGGINPQYVYNFSTRKPSLNDVSIRSLKDPYFDILITADHKVPNINGNVKITALGEMANRHVSLYVAVVEDVSVQSGQNIVVLRNVLKKLLPSSIGKTLKANWAKGDVAEEYFTWESNNVYNPEKIKIVAFIQDDQTREINQVVSIETDPVTSIRPLFENALGKVKLYPNPAIYSAYIAFDKQLQDNYRLDIRDTHGRLLKTFTLFRNISGFELDVTSLTNGLYIIQIYKGNKVVSSQKLIIAR